MYERIGKVELQKRAWRTVVAILLLLFVIVIGGSISGLARARKAKEDSYKYYTSILIEKGDTLWSIASEHMTPEYDRIEDYICEVRRLNHIFGDGIYAGEYLTIPCYFEEEAEIENTIGHEIGQARNMSIAEEM